jgi:uncharacterized protein YlxW (UPF0749 family)
LRYASASASPLARSEVRDLRRENRALSDRLQHTLGAEIQALTQQDALTRLDELERRNRDLLAEIDSAQAACRTLEADKAALEEDLLASRAAHTPLAGEATDQNDEHRQRIGPVGALPCASRRSLRDHAHRIRSLPCR